MHDGACPIRSSFDPERFFKLSRHPPDILNGGCIAHAVCRMASAMRRCGGSGCGGGKANDDGVSRPSFEGVVIAGAEKFHAARNQAIWAEPVSPWPMAAGVAATSRFLKTGSTRALRARVVVARSHLHLEDARVLKVVKWRVLHLLAKVAPLVIANEMRADGLVNG
jgi:hypothetical protein